MKITRKLETANVVYDLTELTKRQFSDLLHCYEKQMYIYYNRQLPSDNDVGDPMVELYFKLKQINDLDVVII